MSKLTIYNTLTRDKEEFQPLKPGFVSIYVCGPTVYGDPHLGHAKSYVSFDVVVRYFRYLGYKVRYVQNITDVGHLTDDADEGEDKLAKQSRIERLEPMEVADKYMWSYFDAMDQLNVQRPDIAPRATGHIPEQIEMIEELIERGYAYESNGNVYFDVHSFKDYGKLSGRSTEDAEAGTRVETAQDKKNPEDFALWKKADPEHIMKWRSPWGVGYPGWHIECSAMSTRYLGHTIDIHGGGLENQFPHHESEIAQCEAAHDEPFVRYWMHNNMVTLNGQKMGKSLGNAISLPQFFEGDHDLLTRKWPPEVIRFFLLQSHYRSTTDFSEEALNAAETGLKNLHEIFRMIEQAEPGHGKAFDVAGFIDQVTNCLNDDFNTAKAIGVFFEQLRDVRKQINNGEPPSNIDELATELKKLADEVLGIWPRATEGSDQQDQQRLHHAIELLLEIRQSARSNRDFETADRIRDRLAEVDITIEDAPQGTTYKIGDKSYTFSPTA